MKKAVLAFALCLCILVVSGCGSQVQDNQSTTTSNQMTEIIQATITEEGGTQATTEVVDVTTEVQGTEMTTDVVFVTTEEQVAETTTTSASDVVTTIQAAPTTITSAAAVITTTQAVPTATTSAADVATTTQSVQTTTTTTSAADATTTTQAAPTTTTSVAAVITTTHAVPTTTTSAAAVITTTQSAQITTTSAADVTTTAQSRPANSTFTTTPVPTTQQTEPVTSRTTNLPTTIVKQTTTTTTTVTTTTTTTVTTTVTTTTTTQSSSKPLRILNIGNSFGHNATSYLADVAAANGKTIEVVNLFKSGCSLEQHWKGYQEDLAQYWYELNGVMFNGSSVTLKSVLVDEEWDIIVTHASPTEAAKNTYQITLNKLIAAVKTHCPDAKYYVMQTWALGDTSIYFNEYTGSTRVEMWSKIESASKLAKITSKLPMIPCGIAAYELENWFEANYPSLSFYNDDDLHADDTWGWYMLSLIWYQTLTGEVPNDTFTAFKSPYTNDPVIRAKVHEIARKAVETYA